MSKKFKAGQILMARTTVDRVYISFYEVIKATTNTCEIRELRKEVVNQTYDDQEVMPLPGEYVSKAFRRKVSLSGAVPVGDNLFAWPWDGKSHWQTVLIFIP